MKMYLFFSVITYVKIYFVLLIINYFLYIYNKEWENDFGYHVPFFATIIEFIVLFFVIESFNGLV